MRSARSIFFEQLIAQLVVWKATDADIILLQDFNENVYTGWITKCLELANLNSLSAKSVLAGEKLIATYSIST